RWQDQKLPRLNIAGHFLCWCKESNQRKHPFFSPWTLSADSTSVLLTADRAHPCARSPAIQACTRPVSRILKLLTSQSQGGEAERAKRLCSCSYRLTALGFVPVFLQDS